MITRHTLRIAALGVLLTSGAQAQTASVDSFPPVLAQPGGGYAIGRTTFAWTDSTRMDALAPERRREVLVHLFYPAVPDRSAPRAPYMPQFDRWLQLADSLFGIGKTAESYGPAFRALRSAQTHSFEHAAVVPGTARFPVVIFSHGGGMPVLFYTTYLEELTSRGYVVAAVEHPFDTSLLLFPDGRFVAERGWSDDAKRTPAERISFHTARQTVNAEDNSFVLSQLARMASGKLRSAPSLEGRLDLSHAAAVGHSLGGAAAVRSCALDTRWSACINLNGGLDSGTVPPIHRPILSVETGFHHPTPPRQNEDAASYAKRIRSLCEFVNSRILAPLEKLTAPSYIASIAAPRMTHFSFYDFPTSDVMDLPAPMRGTPETWATNQALALRYTTAFLDMHLKKAPVSLFEARGAGDPVDVYRVDASVHPRCDPASH